MNKQTFGMASGRPYIYVLLILFSFSIFATSCKKDDDDDTMTPNQEELITTLIWLLSPDGGTTVYRMTFQDLDGDGGNAPIVTADDLPANTQLEGFVRFLNESETPAEEITNEVITEGEEHQIFYQFIMGATTATYDDMDASGNPLGVETTIQTGAPGQEHVRITLRHEPDKAAAGVSGGDITNAGGETDIEVDFHFDVL